MNLHKLYCAEATEKQFYPVPQDEIHAGIPATRTTEALFDLGDRPSRRSLSPWDCFERFFSTDKGSIWAMAAQSTNANIREHQAAGRSLAYGPTVQPSEIRLVFLLRLRLTLLRAESMTELYGELELDRHMPKGRFEFVMNYLRYDIDEMMGIVRQAIASFVALLTPKVICAEVFQPGILAFTG